jgi:hypothetical protein
MRICAAVLLSLLVLAGGCAPAPPPVDQRKLATDLRGLADTYIRNYLDAFPYQALVIGAREVHPSLLVDHSLPAL